MTHLTIEDDLKEFLQRTITITIENKFVRKGKLVLVNLKDYYLVFTLRDHNHDQTYELPYPFAVEVGPKKLNLDYRLKHIHENEPTLLKHNIFCGEKKCKFYDNIVTITC